MLILYDRVMKYVKAAVTKLLVNYFDNDLRRINHGLEVLKESENLLRDFSGYDYDIVIASALLHDVGIKKSEELLGYNNGKTQEEYGPDIAEELLITIGFPDEKIRMVKEIIGNHHSPSRYGYIELEILKKADRVVNANDPD